jgi:glycosyltransferase involved in cell wall biosynthesis
MRVALVHSRYSSAVPSGENAVVDAEHAALQRAGVEVRLFQTDPEVVRSRPSYPLTAAARVATGRGPAFTGEITAYRPDVVHVHNAFPDLGERDLSRLDLPLVLTVHNYRSFCANGYAFRDGHTCVDCLTRPGRSWNGVVHGCHRGRLGSIPLAVRNHGGPAHNPLFRAAITAFIPSTRARDVLVRAGLPPDRAVVSPHFLPDSLTPVPGTGAGSRGPYVFVGRLTAEKGLDPLLAQWPADRDLVVIGDGDDRDRLARIHGSGRVRFTGRLERSEVVEVLRSSRALVFSSLWWETFGLVAMEALAAGTPVVSVGEHAVADLVLRHGVGHAVGDASGLPGALDAIEAVAPADWEGRVTAVFEDLFSEMSWVRRRVAEYAAALAAAPGR